MMPFSRRSKLKQHRRALARKADQHRTLLLKIAGGIVGLIVLVQLFYPAGRMPLFASVDGVSVSGWDKTDVIKELDKQSANQHISLSLGTTSPDYDMPVPADVGLGISNKDRVQEATYPWYIRIIPTSLAWFGLLQHEQSPSYKLDEAKTKEYLTRKIGEGCVIPAKDATLHEVDSTLQVVPAKSGGTCEEAEAVKVISKATPRLNKPASVIIPVTVIAPNVGDDEAKQLATRLNKSTDGGVRLKVADKTQTIEQREVLSWLAFAANESGLSFSIAPDKANAYLAKVATPLVSKPAGITKVSTLDFTETSRAEGATGQTLAVDATIADVARVVNGDKKEASVSTTPQPPKVEYVRSYTKSSAGIAAQMKHYDEDNAGVFGVSFSELGGQGLSGQHNGDKQFVTASTYKLFVAFSIIKRVESGKLSWSDANIASGRDLTKCFDDMIVKSDNACAEALLKKVGANDLNADIKSLGLNNTAFKSDNNVTTPNDLAKYLTMLEKGTMPIKPENKDRLLGAMKRNVYRQGVPAGASGQVADKVGFLWGLLHDATIVYSPKGTYVLVVMTDGSTWGNIADLTRKIEALR